ncbi:MAG: class II aldolase/adducin family protein, partial [Candidatus Dormibacteraceae bacterium]
MAEDAIRRELVETVHAVVRSGAISMSMHGNASIRLPGRDEFLYTAAGALDRFDESGVVRIAFDGTVLQGEVPPMAAAVIAMHTAIYQEKPETGCVIHTHSPYATAFAVANQPIECWTEGFGIFGIDDG